MPDKPEPQFPDRSRRVYRADQSCQRDLINGTVEPQTATALQAKFKRHSGSRLRLRWCFCNREINRQKNRANAQWPQTLFLQLMPPSVNLLPGHIAPMRNLRHRCPVNPDRRNNRELIPITPPTSLCTCLRSKLRTQADGANRAVTIE
jgi:hypothetical protein